MIYLEHSNTKNSEAIGQRISVLQLSKGLTDEELALDMQITRSEFKKAEFGFPLSQRIETKIIDYLLKNENIFIEFSGSRELYEESFLQLPPMAVSKVFLTRSISDFKKRDSKSKGWNKLGIADIGAYQIGFKSKTNKTHINNHNIENTKENYSVLKIDKYSYN